ncbi:MOSC domain containing protein [Kribbella flavida DSM 17836]|uniref:MOSC domain containing protein n=1 Tax=Kribbella flavida (strain DSM 17836 / JCM 10339 / NBRC 14399) TaxID=479435 RepID=D2PMG8_KRIFD|nr:MOSC domain-containing protein [Kribbella flavida]ADB30712.1 MOSC domain containing protein [Kribbella flavida DSM 17836]
MRVNSVHLDTKHRFSKPAVPEVRLIEGVGVEGDAHSGATVQHLHLVRKDASAPNLRQVHLIQSELFEELAGAGYAVQPGDLGENITTTGVDLFALPTGTTLHLGDTAVLTLTGLRNPCRQIDKFRTGLLKQVLHKAPGGTVVRRVGVMSVVTTGGTVRPGDPLRLVIPAEPHKPLGLV